MLFEKLEPIDDELLESVRQGDQAGFTAIVRQWQEPLFRMAFRILGDVSSAEDVRQTVFLRLLEAPGKLTQTDRFGAWIRRCAINEALLQLRKKDIDRRAVHQILSQATQSTIDGELCENLSAEEECDRLAVALSRLEPGKRALLTLRFDEGLTFQEIATVLERPVSSVKSQVSGAIVELRELLGVPQRRKQNDES
jgi:RNA polymerase sigma-70 factor, ECF subfamily